MTPTYAMFVWVCHTCLHDDRTSNNFLVTHTDFEEKKQEMMSPVIPLDSKESNAQSLLLIDEQTVPRTKGKPQMYIIYGDISRANSPTRWL